MKQESNCDRILRRLRARGFGEALTGIATASFVTAEEIVGNCREAHIVEARHKVWFVMRREGLSYPAIARLVERDHTTIMYALKKIEAQHRELPPAGPRELRRAKRLPPPKASAA